MYYDNERIGGFRLVLSCFILYRFWDDLQKIEWQWRPKWQEDQEDEFDPEDEFNPEKDTATLVFFLPKAFAKLIASRMNMLISIG